MSKNMCWIGIAWGRKKVGANSICKALVTAIPVTEAKALSWFKRDFPGFRNHTIQPATGEEIQALIKKDQ